MECIMLKWNKEWSCYSFVLDYILYYHYQRILLDVRGMSFSKHVLKHGEDTCLKSASKGPGWRPF